MIKLIYSCRKLLVKLFRVLCLCILCRFSKNILEKSIRFMLLIMMECYLMLGIEIKMFLGIGGKKLMLKLLKELLLRNLLNLLIMLS